MIMIINVKLGSTTDCTICWTFQKNSHHMDKGLTFDRYVMSIQWPFKYGEKLRFYYRWRKASRYYCLSCHPTLILAVNSAAKYLPVWNSFKHANHTLYLFKVSQTMTMTHPDIPQLQARFQGFMLAGINQIVLDKPAVWNCPLLAYLPMVIFCYKTCQAWAKPPWHTRLPNIWGYRLIGCNLPAICCQPIFWVFGFYKTDTATFEL